MTECRDHCARRSKHQRRDKCVLTIGIVLALCAIGYICVWVFVLDPCALYPCRSPVPSEELREEFVWWEYNSTNKIDLELEVSEDLRILHAGMIRQYEARCHGGCTKCYTEYLKFTLTIETSHRGILWYQVAANEWDEVNVTSSQVTLIYTHSFKHSTNRGTADYYLKDKINVLVRPTILFMYGEQAIPANIDETFDFKSLLHDQNLILFLENGGD